MIYVFRALFLLVFAAGVVGITNGEWRSYVAVTVCGLLLVGVDDAHLTELEEN